ncbi:hypothetical protein [Paenibacillus gallinarum]|uniref:Uncharacterized protein n=1 Tax=Paenibacillus gallinarum TaxID=2762232 RepID=A0ABR8T3P4_9BACL|nr:hypothetical protein [Paenibacillus gallinarum]MBD7970317.1 hypothetical protein [Paenibacillus gallinarum]
MEVFSYNRASNEGVRIRRLLDVQYNESQLDVDGKTKTFGLYEVPAVMHSRVNKVKFLFESNLSGFKRPQVHVEADVELAWGDFADHISALNFKHEKQELPLTYIQPLEDETLKVLIDAGLYRDGRFEQLMGKLMAGETFDAEGNMHLAYLDIAEGMGSGRKAPLVLVDPVNIVHDKHDSSERTNLAELVRLAANNAIELQREGVKTEDLVNSEPEEIKEVVIQNTIQDVIVTRNEQRIIDDVDSIKTTSSLLDEEIDVTEQIKSTLGLGRISEDDRIRDLKERDRYEKMQKQQQEAAAISQKTINDVKTLEAEQPLDPNLFVGGIGSKRRSSEENEDRFKDDEGPSL